MQFTAGGSSTLVPSEGLPDAVPTKIQWACVPKSIEWLNINKLDGKARLNDEVVNCYLLNLLGSRPSKKRIYIFSSFLYQKIEGIKTDAGIFSTVRSWTSKIDLLSHNYIMVPIYQPQNEHWWMAIICNPGQLDPCGDGISVDKPFRIINLDSLGNVRHSDVAADLTAYLVEYKKAQTSSDVSTPSEPGLPAKRIPIQQNAVDCGVFMLHFSEEFIRNPDEFVRRITEEDSEPWPFDPAEWRKRAQIEISHYLEAAVEADLKAKMEDVTSRMDRLDEETNDKLHAVAKEHRKKYQCLALEQIRLCEEISHQLPAVAATYSWAKPYPTGPATENFTSDEYTIVVRPSDLHRPDTSQATGTGRKHPATTAQVGGSAQPLEVAARSPPSDTAAPAYGDVISISSGTGSEEGARTQGPSSDAAAITRRGTAYQRIQAAASHNDASGAGGLAWTVFLYLTGGIVLSFVANGVAIAVHAMKSSSDSGINNAWWCGEENPKLESLRIASCTANKGR